MYIIFQEINSLETPQEVATTNGKTVPDPTNAAALLYDPTTFDPSTQGESNLNDVLRRFKI